jgi:hypothetical protein
MQTRVLTYLNNNQHRIKKLSLICGRKVQKKNIPPCPAQDMNFLALFLKALYQLKYPKNKRNAIRLEIPSIFG